jgi:hypothetical protein
MGAEDVPDKTEFNVGDIVQESLSIVPPDRKVWTGIVVHIEKNRYQLFSPQGPFEDRIYVHWLQPGYIESLPASVLEIIQKVEIKV